MGGWTQLIDTAEPWTSGTVDAMHGGVKLALHQLLCRVPEKRNRKARSPERVRQQDHGK